jgi:drug/metabolite transporter (DMT)-like permease
MTRPSPNRRWWPLLALPVLCCVGHAVLLAVGVGSVTALVGGAVGSAVVAAAAVLLTAVAVTALLRRRERPAATPSARPDLTESTPEGELR